MKTKFWKHAIAPGLMGGNTAYQQCLSLGNRCEASRHTQKLRASRVILRYARVVSSPRTIHNLALVGFMGTGKSSVGQLVAAQLHFRFVDTDELVEGRSGKPITSIFAEEGEARFREYERTVVEELKTWYKTVIATGGGLVANPENLASLKTHALVICLWASAETIWERVRHQTHRPLLQAPDPLTKIRELLAQREPFYRQADVLVNTEMRSLKEVVHQVIHQFRLARGHSPHP